MDLMSKSLLSVIIFLTGCYTVAQIVPEKVVDPTTRFQFSEIDVAGDFKISVDRTTEMQTTDSDGDPLVGAVFRLTPHAPIEGVQGNVKLGATIYKVIAACGYNGIVIVGTTVYDSLGRQVEESQEIKRVRPERGSPFARVYQDLCYRFGSGNNLGWV